MRVTEGSQTSFIITDLDPAYYDTVRDLFYRQLEDGFGKTFPTNTPNLDSIYRNFERYAEAMVLQTACVHPVPWEQSLLAFLRVVEQHSIDWWLCGSAALSVRGIDIEPRDIDLVVADSHAQKLGDLLVDYLIEPVVPVQDWFCRWFGRAFLYARLEWVGGVDDTADQPEISDFGPAAESRLQTIVWQGQQIRVPPVDLQLEVNRRRGLTDRAEMIERFLENRG